MKAPQEEPRPLGGKNWVTNGRRLRASESVSVDREHNVRGTPILDVDSARAAAGRERMDQAPYNLDEIRRDVVMEAIWEVHARSNHVHTVVDAEIPPERIMSDFKAYASRRLNRLRLDELNRKRWARHGSTRWLWKPQHVSAAMQYVLAEQGEAMSAFEFDET